MTMNRNVLRSLSLLSLAACALSARAGLLIDPAGGAPVFGPVADDSASLRALGGTFSLYGQGYTSLYATTNGYLGTTYSAYSADRSLGLLADVEGGAVVAGLYDDLYVYAGNSVTERLGGGFYALTYDLNGYNDDTPGTNSVFQIALFNAAGTFGGNALRAGDVVLSYDRLNSAIDDQTFSVGIAESGANAQGAFGGDGQFGSFGAFTSGFDPATQAILFRYDAGRNAYSQSLIPLNAAAVPGPAAGLSFALMALRRRRRV